MNDTEPGSDAASLESLMRLSLAGDQAAYASLLCRLDRWLRRYYGHRLPVAAIDDAVQEALIAIHDKRHTFSVGSPLLPWVAAIARYKWIDRLRSMARADEPLGDDVPAVSTGSQIEAAMTLDALLKMLKPAQAEVIRLVKLQGFSIAEASRRTGQSESLVKVNIHRGLAALSSRIERSPELA